MKKEFLGRGTIEHRCYGGKMRKTGKLNLGLGGESKVERGGVGKQYSRSLEKAQGILFYKLS